MLKKKLVVSCLGFSLLFTNILSAPTCVAYGADTNLVVTKTSTDSKVVVRAVQTEWRYRVVDDKLQKRLWSLTWGKWLTDWEWV